MTISDSGVRSDTTAYPKDYLPPGMSAKEAAALNKSFWSLDSFSPGGLDTRTLFDFSHNIRDASNPALPHPKDVFIDRSNRTQEKYPAAQSLPSQMEDERINTIQEMGQAQGLSKAEIKDMQYFNDNRDEIPNGDTKTAAFLSAVDQKAWANLVAANPALASETMPSPEPGANAAGKLVAQNFENLLAQQTGLSDDDKTALRNAFYHYNDNQASPEMKAKVGPLYNQALDQAHQEGVPKTVIPKLDSSAIDDELAFDKSQAFESELKSMNLSPEQQNQVRFLFYHSKEAAAMSPEDQAKFKDASAIEAKISGKVSSEFDSRFGLPSDWTAGPTLSSGYDAEILADVSNDLLSAATNYANKQTPPLTQDQIRQIVNSVINPNDPSIDPKMAEIGKTLWAGILPQIQQKYDLPANFTPPLGKINAALLTSPVGMYMFNLISSTENDLKSAITTLDALPKSPETNATIDMLKRILSALSTLKQDLFKMQSTDSAKSREFSKAESAERQESIQLNMDKMAKQAKMEAKAAKKAKMMKWLGPVLLTVALPFVVMAAISTAGAAVVALGAVMGAALSAAAATAVTAVIVTTAVATTLAIGIDQQVNGNNAILTTKIINPLVKDMGDMTQKLFGDAALGKMLAQIFVVALVSALGTPVTGVQVMMSDANFFVSFFQLLLPSTPECNKFAQYAGMAVGMVFAIFVSFKSMGSAASSTGTGVQITTKTAETVSVTAAETTATAATSATSTIEQAAKTATDAVKDTLINAKNAILDFLKNFKNSITQFGTRFSNLQTAQSEFNGAKSTLDGAKSALEAAKTAGTATKDMETAVTNAQQALDVATKNLQIASKAFDASIKSLETTCSIVQGMGEGVQSISDGMLLQMRADQTQKLANMEAALENIKTLIDLLSTLVEKFFEALSGSNSLVAVAGEAQDQIDSMMQGLDAATTKASYAV